MLYEDRLGRKHEKPADTEELFRVGAHGFCVKDNKLLMVKSRFNQRWELPGGTVMDDETILQAFIREVEEETGYLVLPEDITHIKLAWHKFYDENTGLYLDAQMNFFRIGELGNQKKSAVPNSEVLSLAWMDVSDLNDENTNRVHLPVIRNVMDKLL